MCVCTLIYLKQETIVHVLFFLSRRWESKPDITSSRCQSQCLTRCREAFRHIAGEGITWTKNKSLYLWGLLQSVGVGDMMTWLNRKGALVLIPQVLNQLQQCRWDMLRYVHSSTVSPTCCFCYQLHTGMHNGRGARLHPLWSRTHSTCDSRGINYPCTAKGNELRCDWENPKWVLKQSESSHSIPSAPWVFIRSFCTLSSKNNQRNVSAAWPHCLSTLLQDEPCEHNSRPLYTCCARRWGHRLKHMHWSQEAYESAQNPGTSQCVASTQRLAVYGQLQQIPLSISAVSFVLFSPLSLTERERLTHTLQFFTAP